jgi:dipeptidyl aminopeptidase/acylaminoacyl peptidase
MLSRTARLSAIGLVAGWGALFAAAAPAAPLLSAFGSTPSISLLALSPDGSRYALLVGNEANSEVQIRMLADNALVTETPTGKAKVRAIQWAGTDHLLVTTSTTTVVSGLASPRAEWFQMFDYSLKKNRWGPALGPVKDTMNVVSGTPTVLRIKNRPVIVVAGINFPDLKGVSTLLRADLDTTITNISEGGFVDTIDWLVGADGKFVARVDYDQVHGEWRLLLRTDDGYRRVYSETAPVDRPSLLGFGEDGKTVLVNTHRSGEWATYEVNIADGKWSAAREDLDTDDLITDPSTNHLIGTIDTSLDDTEYRFFNPNDQLVWKGVRAAFPGELVTLVSWSDDRMTIVVLVEGPTNGAAYYVVDRRAKSARFLADRYKGIEPGDLGRVETLHYKAGDGTDIPAYLTLPVGSGKAPKGLPLVVLAHGGPASRDYPGVDWWAQALASRGYAVLQPQFRGSSGFGASFRDAGFGQWGRRMQTDLSDGVRHLAKAGTIDPARVCIVSASYGGYAALAGVTLDPGVYRCASAVAGVSDLRRMLVTEVRDAGSENNRTLRYWQRFMGAKNADDKSIDAFSPARLAGKVTVPIQLVHGKDDTVVLYEQSQMMEKALKAAGKPVEFVTLPGEDHWLSRATTRIQMLEAVVAFVQRNNPVALASAAAQPAGAGQ